MMVGMKEKEIQVLTDEKGTVCLHKWQLRENRNPNQLILIGYLVNGIL